MRELLEDRPGSRPPGTSEMLEILDALFHSTKSIDDAFNDLSNLAKRLPLLGILLKTRQDQELYRNQIPGEEDE